MRVCHVITKPELGGAQLSTLNIIKGLSRDKYKVSFITSFRGILKADFRNIKGIKTYFLPYLVRHINPILDIVTLISLYRIYIEDRYDIIHTHSSKAGIIARLAAKLARVKYIIHTVHGWSFNDYQNIFVKNLYINLEKFIARFTTKIVCVSKRDIETGLKYNIASRDKFVLIRYGIDLKSFREVLDEGTKLRKRKELGINNNDPIIGMISCLKQQKAPLDYIKACIGVNKVYSNVNFLQVGDGVLRKDCEKALKKAKLNDRFIFTGWRRDISEILDILDIVVLTSKWEGLPITVLEALSKGKALIVTDVGGSREIIRDGINGFLVKPGDYKDTLDKILKLLKDKLLFEAIKKEASLSIDASFSIENMVTKVDNLYNNLSSCGLTAGSL